MATETIKKILFSLKSRSHDSKTFLDVSWPESVSFEEFNFFAKKVRKERIVRKMNGMGRCGGTAAERWLACQKN